MSGFNRHHFAEKITNLLQQQGISQNQLAQEIGISRSTVTGWLRHNKLPDAEILSQLCGVLGCSADQLLGLDSQIEKTDISGRIRWVEQIPSFIGGVQKEQIEQGIRAFNLLLHEDTHARDLMNDYNLSYLQLALQAAIRSGALRLLGVQRDTAAEFRIKERYPSLKHIVVADVPKSCDSTLLRAEFVAFLAATEILTTVIREPLVGLGTGYTTLRLCEQSIPGVDQFRGTRWLPLVTFTNDHESGYTANHLARLMETRHPGSHAVYLPHPDLCKNDPQHQTQFEEASRLMQNVQTLFLTVNGVGRRERTIKTYPLTDFRTVDYAFDSAYLRDRYAELPDKEAFGAELLSYLLDREGHVLGWDKARVWQLDLEILRYNSDLVGKVVIVAARDYKAEAVETCIRTGLTNAIVIDNEIARYLLERE